MSLFSDIPVRSNSSDGTVIVTASWWNTIRTKLIAYAGGGVTGETTFTITDNRSSYTAISGLSFDGNTYGYARVRYTLYRFDGSSDERKESGTLILNYKKGAGTWAMDRVSEGPDDALNIAGSIRVDTSSKVGSIEYKSDNMGGTYEGTGTFKVLETFNVET